MVSETIVESFWEVVESSDQETLKVSKNADQQEIDAKLAEDMNACSIEERERSFEELHGVAKEVSETSEMIQETLGLLAEELASSTMVDRNKASYDLAMTIDKGYVENPKFRLMFLRAERFDAKKAAARLVLFMEKKRKFFGDGSMVRPLTLKDLTKDDLKTMRSGANQILQCRDRSGRLVIVDFSIGGPQLYTDLISHLRVHFYLILSAIENDYETQKRGVVTICWYFGPLRLEEEGSKEGTREGMLSLKWLPFRITATHICMDNLPMKAILARVLRAVGPAETRKTTRIHQGTPTEVQYKLLTFGIPIESLPMTGDGKVKSNNQRKHMARMKTKEGFLAKNGGKTFDRVSLPSKFDVLLGKGKPVQQHQGNVMLRYIVESQLEEYAAASHTDKAMMTWKVVDTIKQTGKFLKKDDDDWWADVLDQEARDKIGKTFVSLGSRKEKPLAKAVRPETNGALSKRLRLEPPQGSKCLSLCRD